jgi:hypothetical protein
MSGDERYVLDEAQAEIKRLTAENARLRGEAKKRSQYGVARRPRPRDRRAG